jgi:hypothetical protein
MTVARRVAIRQRSRLYTMLHQCPYQVKIAPTLLRNTLSITVAIPVQRFETIIWAFQTQGFLNEMA